MATIRTAIALYDGVTSPLQSMTKAMNIVLNSFEAVQMASGHAVDTSAIQQAREELARTESALNGIEENIRQSDQEQQRFNNSIRGGSSAADGLWSKVKGIAATVGGMMAIQKVLGLSDQLAGAEARLSLIVDDGGSVSELEKKIMASAQRSRSSYLDTMQSVSKIGLLAGKSFENNDEMIKFAELMNKNFVIAGASAQEQSSAMYQLNQALGSGRLQGDEYRSIIENAPLLAQAIEGYMRDAGVEGTMKEWSADGLLTAEVIKNALFSSADEVEARFEQMPMAWGQVWTSMKNKAISIFSPILDKINGIANSEKFNTVVDGMINGLAAVGAVAGGIFDLMITIASGIVENWSWIEPIVWGIVAALIAYNGAMFISNTVQAIQNGIKAISTIAAVAHGAAITGEMTATTGMTAAQIAFNAALYACPLTWILLIIIIVIAAIYAIVGAINAVTGSTISATGVICGAVMWLLSVIGNIVIGALNSIIQFIWTIFVEPFIGIIEWVLNVANGGFNSFGDGVANLIGNIISWFLSLGKVVTQIIDAIFGTDWTSGLSSLQDSVLDWGKNDQAITLERKAPTIDYRFDNSDAYNMGYDFGVGIDDKVSKMFDFESNDPLGAGGTGLDLGEINGNTGDTASNTAAMGDALDTMEEDMAYMLDLSEREAINRFTTRDITINQTNENHIGSDMDLDGVLDRFSNDLTEELDVSGEGVPE